MKDRVEALLSYYEVSKSSFMTKNKYEDSLFPVLDRNNIFA